MKESHVRHLFNEPGDRVRVRVGLGHAVAGQPRIAFAMACYLVWMIACCTGPAVALSAEGAGGETGLALLMPAWMGPLACMAAASVVIAVWFKKTRKVPSTPSWMVALASLMTLAAALHLVWALDTGLPVAARWALYALSSVVMGAGCALFRVEIDRVFGWIGTQQTLSQGMAATLIAAAALAVLTLVGDAAGASETPLLVVALVLPFASMALLRAVVSGFPRVRYFGHGLDVPLPFPAKFVATSFVQGAAAGVLFAGVFALGIAGGTGAVEGAAGVAGMVGVGAAVPASAEVLLRAVGQMVAVGLLFATLVFLRLDFNRLVYKVAFPFVAAGFVLLALLPDTTAVGGAVLAAAFCFLDLVLWSLGACLMKNMGLPATWIASCPGAALFCGAVAGSGVTLAFLSGVASSDAALLASLVACFVLAAALLLSSGSNLKYGWGTVRPGESSLATGDLAGIVKFVATERGITQRESEVMLLLAQGKSRRAVCEELSVSPDTVKTHVRSIYRKLAVHSQQELADLLAREREDLAADASERPLEE
ncbi:MULTISPECIES: response regulator transcription factor [Gordonibacter]|uniref:Helix-turn-helix transcriptional regulator n=1 Tax=Gordonibacter faecis TaxID=3047475 RepID=A0ABT7DLF7_9ACTN|nr:MULTISPECIES: helix-turn-helix transcriptional regulator [unclassified Gordonibacter]MDJ1650368.1 helix-turn-helix transcriptional regulator [Gordonibacter sp. KGMB12511]HIW76787.1 helix-turn-helix transcriptional regulator [Candidatus Gordonibacter avicola]